MAKSAIVSGARDLPASVELAGAREAQWQAVRGRRVAFVGQEPASGLDPTQTVGAALSEVIRAYSGGGRSQARERALALLSRVKLDDPERVAKLYPHQVSGGMAQRVTIARALAGDPEILVADEPTTALDVTIQADILALLRSLQLTSGIAVLLVTHDWGVVAGLADDVLVMYAGQAVERSAAEDVFGAPRHPYTEALLRSDPHAAAPGRALPVIAGTVPSPGQWPAGCRFAGRCGYVTADCTAAEPALAQAEPGHQARCIHADLLAAR
jgi:peptide/nickel transport system permease protein